MTTTDPTVCTGYTVKAELAAKNVALPKIVLRRNVDSDVVADGKKIGCWRKELRHRKRGVGYWQPDRLRWEWVFVSDDERTRIARDSPEDLRRNVAKWWVEAKDEDGA